MKDAFLSQMRAFRTFFRPKSYTKLQKASFFELFIHAFEEASVQIWRHPFLSLATLFLTSLVLFLLSSLFAVQSAVEIQWKELEKRADFSVILQENYDSFELEKLYNALSDFAVTPSVSAATSWQGIDISPRLRVSFSDLSDLKPVFGILKNPRYEKLFETWDETAESNFLPVVENLLLFKSSIQKVLLFLVGIFGGIGLILYFYTFQMVAFSRRDELFIAKSVGASPFFILLPFIFEGLFLGLISGVLSLFLFTIVLTQLPFSFSGEIFLALWNSVFVYEIFIAGILGALGAFLSAWWFIRVKS